MRTQSARSHHGICATPSHLPSGFAIPGWADEALDLIGRAVPL
jgi:hypothetical protein